MPHCANLTFEISSENATTTNGCHAFKKQLIDFLTQFVSERASRGTHVFQRLTIFEDDDHRIFVLKRQLEAHSLLGTDISPQT